MLDLLPDVKTSLSISKPNTPTGMLEVEKVILKQTILD